MIRKTPKRLRIWVTKSPRNCANQEMCRIVGDVVFAMVAEGHETKRVAIADVIRTEIAKGLGKWDLDQIQVMELAVKLLEE
ncbi:Protein of uncharacterised function (DUF2767) [Raoultella terrigena]|nr:Protein of uncharacterised function (DUF2767) [Raoultella terrigena]